MWLADIKTTVNVYGNAVTDEIAEAITETRPLVLDALPLKWTTMPR